MNNYEIEEDEIDIHKIIVHLKKNLKTIFFITFLVTTIAAAYAYFKPSVYASSVSIAFSDEKTSKLTAIIPDEFAAFGSSEKELETVKLTLETRKFINRVIKDLNISQRYYVAKHYRKNEQYALENLKVSLNIHDETLYEEYFKIEPIDAKSYLLKVDALDYEKKCNFNEEIHESFFNITVLKLGALSEKKYFVRTSDKSLLAEAILRNMQTSILSDNVIKISYNDTVPQRAKEIVEKIAEEFKTYTLNKKTIELTKTLAFLDKQIEGIENQLNKEGTELKQYQQKSESFLPMESNIALFDTLVEKKEHIKNLKLQLLELSNFKQELNHNKLNTIALLNSGIEIASIQSLIERFRADEVALNEMQLQAVNIEKSITKNEQLSKLISQLNAQKKLLSELIFNFTEGHPQVVQAQGYLLELESDIHTYIQTSVQRLTQSQTLTKQKILSNIVTTQNSINAKLKVLKQDVTTQHALLQSLPEKDLNIQELKRKFTLSENIYTFLLQKKMEVQISKESTIANTQIIEDAIIALKPIKPNKKLIVVVGFILGLILGVLYTAIRAMLDSKIRDASTIEELTDAPLYGMLPFKTNKRFFDEALRNIRTNLQFVLPRDKACTTMLISSTVPGEGKTTVIAGLADVISKTGKKVLLMDLDLRKPRLYREIGKSNKQGMTQFLVGGLEIESCIQSVNENLDFFAAGAVPPNPSELLMSEKFDATIDTLMKAYDYILFDTAPIGTVIDANMLLKHSDILLLIVKANVAEKSFLDNFNRLRADKGIKSSGIILNQFKLNNSDQYGYGYGYGYGYNYGHGSTKRKGEK